MSATYNEEEKELEEASYREAYNIHLTIILQGQILNKQFLSAGLRVNKADFLVIISSYTK